MDDLELINLASKASGVEYAHADNPLVSDALALRLAVKLKIDYLMYMQLNDDLMALYATEPYAATRRAIVRTAAEIGKGME